MMPVGSRAPRNHENTRSDPLPPLLSPFPFLARQRGRCESVRGYFQSRRSCPSPDGHPETMKCHSERSEESCSGWGGPLQKGQGEIPRFARNDRQFQSSHSCPSAGGHPGTMKIGVRASCPQCYSGPDDSGQDARAPGYFQSRMAWLILTGGPGGQPSGGRNCSTAPLSLCSKPRHQFCSRSK
jgi:hypothetical protein